MSFIFNDTTIKGVNFNGTTVKKVIYNGVTVFTADKDIFKDGVLADGVTVSSEIEQSENTLECSVYGALQTHDSKNKTGTITFDMTDFSSITIKGTHRHFGYSQNAYTKTISIGSNVETLTGGYTGLWGTDGDPASIDLTFDVSELSGSQSISLYVFYNNLSDYYPAGNYIDITEIIAYS